jgi:hypothetical protein
LSGFAFYAFTQDVTQHYNNTMSSMNDMDWNRNQESIIIRQIATTGTNQLNITAENDGSIQSHLIWLGIFNTTATPENQTYQALNELIAPSEIDSIISNFTVTAGNKYVVQLVTELGNVVESKFYPASYVSCALTLVTAPPTVYQGNNVTVLLTVTLNDTIVDSIQSLTTNVSATPASLVQLMSNSSLSVSVLARGTSAFFWWIYNAANTGTVTFNATYLQAPAGAFSLSTVQIVSSPPQGGQGNVTITGINCTASQNPSQWNLLGSTQNVSGSIADLASNDSSYAIFNSYPSQTNTDINHFVDNNSSNVDNSTNIGTHSNFTAMQKGPDSINDTLTEGFTGTTTACYPSSYNLLGSTQNVSGTISNLQTDDGLYMTFRSYASATSAKTLYAHQETIAIGGSTYYLSNLTSADATGTTLSADTSSTGRKLMGKFVYQLTGVSMIPASTWTFYYRAMQNHGNIVAHCDVDLLIRQSNGTVRTTIATDVANSSNIPTDSNWYTLSQTYAWTAYTVANSTDYLEIDYYIHVTGSQNNKLVSLQIDDNTLASVDQTRATNILLPSEYTSEVEFLSTSNTQPWSQLVWTIDSSFSTAGITATFQLYNYTANAYSTVGAGYITDTIGTSNVTETQTITVNPTQFRDNATGNWKMKIKGVKTTTSQFNWTGDLIRYQALNASYQLDLEVQWTGAEYTQANAWLCISYGRTMGSENLLLDIWTGSAWQNISGALSNGWNNVSVSSYLTSSNLTIRFRDATPGGAVQNSWNIDVCLLHLWTTADAYTAEIEFTGSSNLQSWTSLVWFVDSSWDTGSVNVTIQIYNWTLGDYPLSGNGYVSYVSSATPYADETKSQTMVSGATQFRNSTGYWKVKIKGVKSTSTQFRMRVDWIELQDSYASTGGTIPYKACQWYTIQATGASGIPVAYTYVSLYANGTTVTFQNATDAAPVPNPAWIRLDANGTFQLQLKSATSPGETFVLSAAVGTVVEQKTITQAAQQ